MGLQSVRWSPRQFLPRGRAAPSTPAVALSLALHGGFLALALMGTQRWQPLEPQRAVSQHSREAMVAYVAVGPPAGQPGEAARHAGKVKVQAARARRASPPAPRISHAALFAVTPSVVPAKHVSQLNLQVGFMKAVPAPSFTPTPGASATGSGDRFQHGAGKVAELLTWAGNACPALRGSAIWGHGERHLEVAVAFVVDTLGFVDPGTLRVVQAPGAPSPKPEFFPHIYVVGTTARVDHAIRHVEAAYDTPVGDVLRHVASLRFRSALVNGRPARSTVLVSCQAH
jgi:hypothetical protein